VRARPRSGKATSREEAEKKRLKIRVKKKK
jgi:hypothetical protein